jgi:hypothetical protein
MTYETGPGLALFCPFRHKNRIAASLSMRTALPRGLKVGVAYRAILRELLRGRAVAILRTGDYKRNARSQQREHQGNQESFDSDFHVSTFSLFRFLKQA